MKKLLVFGLIFLGLLNNPVYACLSCGCSSSGSSSDLGSLGAASSIFSKGKMFLFQLGSGLRSINGTFNEIGNWNPSPTDSGLYSLQNTLGLMYFPTTEISLGIQLPLVSNFLSKATWGSFGSIAPTDLPNTSIGTGLGDINLQATYKFYDDDSSNFASAIWGKGSIPTGSNNGKPENMTGSGVTSIAAGIFGIKKLGKFEILANIGYQQPLGKSPNNTKSFSVGNAFLYQLQGSYQINPDFKAGLGLSGIIGKWLFTNSDTSMTTSKIGFLVNAQYDLTPYNGIGLSIGYDPKFLGTNAMTDNSLNIVFYQFL